MLLKNKNLKSVRKSVRKQKKIRAKSIKIWLYINGCGSKTRTYDLRVMSPTSYQLLHPAILVEGEGFEPSKPEAADLQSAPFNHSGIPPRIVITNKLELAKGIEPSTY